MYKIGIVGVGGMGTVHLNNYKYIDDARVVALCDISPSAQELAQKEGVPCYSSLIEMLKGEDVDVIDICTPTFTHKEKVIEALNAGKHVICEKPIALNFDDAMQMLNLAKTNKVKLFIAHVVRYMPQTLVLKQLIESKEYGSVLDAQFLRLSAAPRWVKNGWLFDKEKSGLLPFDLHIHDLDLIVSLFGLPKEVSYTSCKNKDKSYEEHFRFTYKYEDLNVSAEAAWYNADFPFTATWRVYFENAVVINDNDGVTAYAFDAPPKKFDTEEKIKIPTGINLPPTQIFLTELTDFLGQLKEDYTGCKREKEILGVVKILEEINK